MHITAECVWNGVELKDSNSLDISGVLGTRVEKQISIFSVLDCSKEKHMY